MQKILVKVTQEHIDKGNKDDCSTCPVALALTSTLPGRLIAVGTYVLTIISMRISIEKGVLSTHTTTHIDLPEIASEFIRKFDNGEEVMPFEFELEIPEEFLTEHKK